MKKVLFISWDGPQTSYMEGLFFPIFSEIQKQSDYEFHVLQFTWAEKEKLDKIKSAAEQNDIKYVSSKIHRKPVAILGSMFTVFKAPKIINQYIHQHGIDVLMPRSTFPAMMINRLSNKDVKVIFDADGLAIDERVDFSGLSKISLMYKILKSAETKLLNNSDAVITRSQKAIDIHVNTIGEKNRSKFSVVSNGRNIEHFKFNSLKRAEIRKELGLEANAKLWVYCGSLGPQYGWDEMMEIFSLYHKNNSNSKFLILTGNIEFAKNHINEDLKDLCTIKSVAFSEVPNYLSASDLAFALRQPTYSMQGVAPIKLGEYLLMALPSIASKGIGDSEEILRQIPGNFIFDHSDKNAISKAVEFAENLKVDKKSLRQAGIKYFSIEESAKSYIKVLNELQ